MSADNAKPETRIQGVGVSPGVARGTLYVVDEDGDEVTRHQIEPSDVSKEIGRFESALIQTRSQILEMQERIAQSIGAKDAGIFDAHLLVVEDRTLIDEVLRKLQADLCNVEFVFQEVATNYANTLSEIDDPYLRERALDIQDVTRRVVRNLLGKAPKDFLGLTHHHILLAHNITPSDTATMSREFVLGMATDLGSRTSHTAIMARSLGIPAVVGLHNASEKLDPGQEGIFLLHKTKAPAKQRTGAAKKRNLQSYVVLHDHDFLPVDKASQVTTLLQSTASRKSSKARR